MKKFWFAVPLLATFLIACDNPVPPSNSNIVAASGGTVSGEAGRKLEIPANALSADSIITISTSSSDTTPAPVGQSLLSGSVVSITASNGAILSSATLTLPFDAAAVGTLQKPRAALSSLALYQLLAGVWTKVNGAPTINGAFISQLISALGTYGLFAPTTPPTPTISSIVLACNPISLAVAAASTCTATAKNSSGANLATQPAFTFNSSDMAKATVSSGGVVTGVAAGSANITALSGGITSNAVTITVTAAPSGGGVTIISSDQTARGKAISANGRVFFTTVDTLVTGNQFGYVYDGTTSKALPALPSGYTGISNDAYALACIDSNGNVAFVAYKTGRINHALYFDKAANGISVIAFGDENFVFGCNDAKQVVGSDFNPGQKTHFKWQANDANSTQLSRTSPSGIIGYRALDINNSGTILFPDGILKGVSFTPIPKTSLYGSGLTDAGTVYGLENQQLFKWNEGDAAVTPLGTVPGQIQNQGMRLLGVNNNGDVLLRATGLASSTDYQYWLYKNGVYTRIVVPNYTISEVVGISDDGSILINTAGFTPQDFRVLLFKP
jgi:Bacterial Ig-like domain (group 2)